MLSLGLLSCSPSDSLILPEDEASDGIIQSYAVGTEECLDVACDQIAIYNGVISYQGIS